jgi:hypothetical protein
VKRGFFRAQVELVAALAVILIFREEVLTSVFDTTHNEMISDYPSFTSPLYRRMYSTLRVGQKKLVVIVKRLKEMVTRARGDQSIETFEKNTPGRNRPKV